MEASSTLENIRPPYGLQASSCPGIMVSRHHPVQASSCKLSPTCSSGVQQQPLSFFDFLFNLFFL